MDDALGEHRREGRGDEAPEGHPDGVEGGTALDPDQADMTQTYHSRVSQVIGEHWVIPTLISDDEVDELAGRIRVVVRLTEQGHVDSYEFREKSGHQEFDASVERVIREFEADTGGLTLPLPEQEGLRAMALDGGLILQSWEHVPR